ncbi:MAG: hypothetical protein GY711_28110 [bacterium]|nr:hypothetical protein [bacterium]
MQTRSWVSIGMLTPMAMPASNTLPRPPPISGPARRGGRSLRALHHAVLEHQDLVAGPTEPETDRREVVALPAADLGQELPYMYLSF